MYLEWKFMLPAKITWIIFETQSFHEVIALVAVAQHDANNASMLQLGNTYTTKMYSYTGYQ